MAIDLSKIKIGPAASVTGAVANPILEFAQKKESAPTVETPQTQNPILEFAGKSGGIDQGTSSSLTNNVFGEDAKNLPRTYEDARKIQEQNPSLWQRLVKQLMKPVGVVATAAEQTGLAIGAAIDNDPNTSAWQAIKETPGKIGGIITGTRQNSFGDVWRTYGSDLGLSEEATKQFAYFLGGFDENPNELAQFIANRFKKGEQGLATTIGLVGDITADPLTYVGGGLTRTGKATQKAEALHKAGVAIKEGSKLDKELKFLGLTDDMLKMGATKVEQVQKGQRALLTMFGGTRFEKTLLKGESFYKATAALKTAAGAALERTKITQLMHKAFSTKTPDEAFNVMKEHFDNLMDYRKGKVMDEAIDIQNNVAKLSQEDALRMVDVIETGKKTGVASIDDLAARLSSNFDELHKAESSLGLVKSDIQDYFPHIKVKDKATVAERIGRLFSDPRKYSTALGSSKERQILKFVADNGDELIGKANDLGLKELADGTFQAGKGAKAKIYTAIRSGGEVEGFTKATVKEINDMFGTEFFETRPAVAYAQRALGSAKAQTSKEFFNAAKDFALKTEPILGTADEAVDIAKIVGNEYDDFIKQMVKDGVPSEKVARETLTKGLFDHMKAGGAVPKVQLRRLADGTYEIIDGMNRTAAAKVLGRTTIDATVEGSVVGTKTIGEGVETTIKELKGLKFHPQIAEQLEAYSRALKKDDVNAVLRVFDKVQNWWKAQALVAPSYHVRNSAGNVWNNFLAGVNSADDYIDAGLVQAGKPLSFTDDAGRVWKTPDIIDAAKKSGVIGEGWYAKDIDVALSSEVGGISWNPLKQNNALFRANKAAGSVIENNARLAHFINKLKEGQTIDNAAMSVKKFLFDYGDLTTFEKDVMKRFIPFYTWTRKNIPLQFENLLKQPGKFALIPKVTNTVESMVPQPNEKYLGDYIKNNVGVRVGNDDNGNTYYFLMGQWLPAAQAIDFLSQPAENFIGMITPFIKTPIELWANQSTFFEDSFGQPSKIERYPEENQSWLGFTMRKKTAYILKNIRILNELDKLNPGSIFGDKDSPSLWNRIAPEAGVRLPLGVGTITTSSKRAGRLTPETDQAGRVLQSMFGKLTPYNPKFARKFYLWDTETKVREMERAIKDAKRDGQREYAKRLNDELKKIKKERK